MTIKVSDNTEEIIKFLKTRLGNISNVRAVEVLAHAYLEKTFIMYQDSKIDDDDVWRAKNKEEFYKFLDKINYKPLG